MSDTTETVVINHSEFPLPPQVTSGPGSASSNAREGEIPPDIDGEVVLTRTDGGPNLADLLAGVRGGYTPSVPVSTAFRSTPSRDKHSPAHAASAAN